MTTYSDRPFIDIPLADQLLIQMLSDVYERRLSDTEHDAFESMQGRPRTHLTDRQLKWIQDVAVRLELITEPTVNDWSSRSPAEQERIRGREVPTPPVLLDRPLLPPHRRKNHA